jgi:hypothetical protein
MSLLPLYPDSSLTWKEAEENKINANSEDKM